MMPRFRSFPTLALLAGLSLPALALAQPATPLGPAPAVAPPAGSPTTDDLANRLRGAPTSRSGAATRGLGMPHDAPPPATPPATPGATGG